MIEYCDDSNVDVAGQWMNEIHSFALTSEEAVFAITVFQDKGRDVSMRMPLGIIGLRFVLSSDRTSEGWSVPASPTTTSKRYGGSPFEEIVGGHAMLLEREHS